MLSRPVVNIYDVYFPGMENFPWSFLVNGSPMNGAIHLPVLEQEWLCNQRLHILDISSTISPLNAFRIPRWLPYGPGDLFIPHLSDRSPHCYKLNTDLAPAPGRAHWEGPSFSKIRLVPGASPTGSTVLHLIASLWWNKITLHDWPQHWCPSVLFLD